LAVGPGDVDEKGVKREMHLVAGDKVIYESYAGTEIKINGEKHLLMDVKDILAKYEKGE